MKRYELLIDYFKQKYFSEESNQLKPNDFNDFSSYYLRKAIIESITKIKDENGQTPSDSISFLIHILKNNDNSRNSVCLYIYNYFSLTIFN